VAQCVDQRSKARKKKKIKEEGRKLKIEVSIIWHDQTTNSTKN
jgi:hypothetical protein